jgi:hypothetical protein
VHALQQAFGRQFAQVAPDGVFRQRKRLTERLCDNVAVALQDREDVLLALSGEHRPMVAGRPFDCTHFLVSARNYA